MNPHANELTPSGNHLLVVDDEEDILSILCDVLRAAGYTVDSAANGDEAIARLQRGAYAAVISDIKMPGKDGIAVLKAAKAADPDCAVVLLTGFGALESAVQALQLGAQDYLTKPFDVQHVLRVIERILHQRRLELENRMLHQETRRQRDELAKRVVELNILRQLSVKFSFTFDVARLFRMIFDSLSEALDYQVSAVLDLDKHRILLRSSCPLPEQEQETLIHAMLAELGDGAPDVAADEFAIEYIGEALGSAPADPVQYSFNIVLPGSEGPFGVLNVSRCRPPDFSEADVTFVRDLAEQSAAIFKQLQTVIAGQRGQLQRIIDALPDGLLMIDIDEHTVLANPTAREILKQAPDADISISDVEAALKLNMRRINEDLASVGQPMVLDVSLQPDIGADQMYAAHVALLPKVGGMIQGLVMLLRDVTRERQLQQMQKRWLATISHELRTPTAVLKEFVALLKEELSPVVTNAVAEYLDITENNVERLSRLIDNLLHAAYQERGQVPIATREFDVCAYLENRREAFEAILAPHSITLRIKAPDGPLLLEADPEALNTILTNLLDNARKFSPSGSTVTITLEKRDKSIALAVADQGCGIPHAQQDKIFEPFYRLEQSGVPAGGGSGLGLTIVRDLVRRQGGSILLDSRPGQGATFTIILKPTAELAALPE